MLKQLVLTVSLLGSMSALAMAPGAAAPGAGAQPAAATGVPLVAPILSEQDCVALTNLSLRMRQYALSGENPNYWLEKFNECLTHFMHIDVPFNGRNSILEELNELMKVHEGILGKLDDDPDLNKHIVGRGSNTPQVTVAKVERLRQIEGLLNVHLQLRAMLPPVPAPSRSWTFGYKHLLGGLGIVAVVALVVNYQRSKDSGRAS